MFIIPSYNNVIIRYKTLLSIFMFFVQTIQIKVTSLSLLRKIPPLKVSFMSNLLCLEDRKTFDYHQRKKQLFKAQHPHHRFRVEELDNAHSIHIFHQFEEGGYLEFFFRIILGLLILQMILCMSTVRLKSKINDEVFLS